MGGAHPFTKYLNECTSDWQYLDKLRSKSLVPIFSEQTDKKYLEIMTQCLSYDPSERPSFVQIVKLLQK